MSTQHTKIMFLLDGDYLEEQQVPQIYPDTLFFGGVEDEDTMSYSALPEIGSLLNEAEMKLTTIANAIPYSPGTYTMAVDNSPGSIHNMGLDPGNSSPQYLDMDSIDQSSMVSAELSCLSPPSHLQQQQQQSHLQQNSSQQQQQNTFAGLSMAPSAAHAGLGGYHQELGSCDPMEQVKSLAVTQAMEDMHCACNQLHISPDPHSWTPRDVQCWVQWALQRYGVQPEAHAQNFQMLDGTSLCMLSEDDFKMRSIEAGSNLFVQLEIWKGAFASLNSLPPQISNNVHQQHQYPPQMLDTASPSSSFTDATSFTWHQPQPCDGFYTQGQGHIEQPFSPHYNGELSPASSCSSLDTACPDSEILTANNSDTQSEISEGGVGERTKHNIHLWQFLKELLQSPYHYQNCIRWVDRHQGIFKIEDSARVARLWGKRKNRPAMNYDKLSRSIRQYYKKGIIQKTEHSKRLVYQFCKPYLM